MDSIFVPIVKTVTVESSSSGVVRSPAAKWQYRSRRKAKCLGCLLSFSSAVSVLVCFLSAMHFSENIAE